MAESLINLKHRINSIKSTGKITKAMKLTASVKYQKWKKIIDNNKTYANQVEKNLIQVLSFDKNSSYKSNQCLKEYHANKKLFIVVTSNLGLCGAYNYNIFKKCDEMISDEDAILFIGEKIELYYKNKLNNSINSCVSMMQDFRFSSVKKFRHYLLRLYRKGVFGSVYLIYTKYKNSLNFEPNCIKLLPLELPAFKQYGETNEYSPLIEPNIEAVLDQLIPHYLDSILYKYLLESELSEVSSRRNAMEQANDSANKIVDQLMITYNKTRQAKITQEITEVVSGSNNN